MLSTRMARNALNTWLDSRGYSLRWAPPRIAALDRALAVNFELLAAHLMLTVRQPYCIGIGANDGVTHDPLYPFIRDHGWRGAMVEPIPETFAALEQNYARHPEISLVQAAMGSQDGEATIYAANVPSDGSQNMSLHASFDRDVLLKAKQWYPDIERHIVEHTVPVLCFDTLLARLGRPTVDVIKIDAEGYDFEILKTIDLRVVRPRLLLVEQAHLSREDKVAMAEMMLDSGYRIAMTNLDMLGYRNADG